MTKRLSLVEYRDNLTELHGDEFLKDMDSIFKQGGYTLKMVSDKYNISKMRVTQLFKRLYGRTYREVRATGFAEDSAGYIYDFEKVEKKKITTHIPEWLYNKMLKRCKDDGFTMKQIACDALIEWFDPKTEADKYKRVLS